MEDEQYAAISDYLERGAYPEGYTKSKKFILRRSSKSFKLIDGKLFYKDQNADGTDHDRVVLKKNETEFFLSVTSLQEDTKGEMPL